MLYNKGTAGIVWSIIWFFVTADKPDTHRFIKEKEKEYITSKTNISKDKVNTTKNTKKPT